MRLKEKYGKTYVIKSGCGKKLDSSGDKCGEYSEMTESFRHHAECYKKKRKKKNE